MRRLWFPLHVLLAVVLATGCGASPPPTPTPEPISLRFVYGESSLTAHYEGLATEFEAANRGVDVVLERGNPYNALAGGTAADVVEIDQLAIAELAAAGMLRPLDPLVQGATDFDMAAYHDGVVDALRWRGELWGLPGGVDPWVLYYNQDLFDAEGVRYPENGWTWDDLLTAAQELTDPDPDRPVYGLLIDMGRADFVRLVYQNGGTLVDSLVSPTTVTFTDLATVEAIEWYVGLSLEQGVSPTPGDLQRLGGFDSAVLGGRAAMWFGPFSERGGAAWDTDWPFRWGAVAPPGNRAQMTLITMRAYVLAAATERPVPAWEWVRFLSSHPAVDADVPPLKAALAGGSWRSSLGADLAATADAAMAIGHTIPPATWVDEVANWLGQAMAQVFQQSMSVEDALQSVQERAEALLAEQATR